jgi:hypothetical protein
MQFERKKYKVSMYSAQTDAGSWWRYLEGGTKDGPVLEYKSGKIK